jgi:hypothetical protein
MIYCNLKGGLGNMMFQIAAMNSFSKRSGISCSFPNFSNHIENLKNDKIHNQNCHYSHEYRRFIKNIDESVHNPPQYQVNFPFHYVQFNDIRDGMLFDGFFQSEKYFIDSRDDIVKIFDTDCIDISKYNNFDLKKTCSIHIRRGDYLKFSENHPVISKEYYINSINQIGAKIDHVMIFSDDIEWCKKNFKESDFKKDIMFSSENKDYMEMSLMSKCAHNIIANSSFSWWGAWLNTNPEKIVIAPQQWFGKNLEHLNSSDLIPETWLKL